MDENCPWLAYLRTPPLFQLRGKNLVGVRVCPPLPHWDKFSNFAVLFLEVTPKSEKYALYFTLAKGKTESRSQNNKISPITCLIS